MASMKDVAKTANVGIATVSRVINNSGFVSKETRELVLQAIQDLGYIPNELARSFQKKQANTIGLIIPNIKQSFTSELTYNIERELYNLGYHVLLCSSNHDGAKELEYLDKLKSQQVAGVIITAPFITEDESHSYKDLALVSVDRFINEDIPCIHIDNYGSSCVITEKLLSKAKKKVAYIGLGADEKSVAEERKKAFKDTCRKNNRHYISIEMHFGETLIAYLKRVFSMTQDCDGYFFGCDYHAHKYISYMHTHNMVANQDFYLVSFDGLSTNKDYPYTLTGVQQPFDIFSKTVVQTLMKRINNTEVENDIIVEYTIVEGDTC